jgi:hypothetical protein
MSDSIPTLAVPAPLYDEALAFCNARLAEDGKPPITELPPGEPRNGNSCPCGVACGVHVGRHNHARRTVPSIFGEAWDWIFGAPTAFTVFFDENATGITLPLRDATLQVPA